MNLNQLTIKDALAGIKERKFSITELVSDCLSAIKNKNKELDAYLEVYEESAFEEAKRLDEATPDFNELPPLWGVPFAVKDNILVEGKKASAASKILENYEASYDATVIARLKKAGAIFLGRTNMDEFAMGSSTENSGFGPTKNPYDLERVPGGSSGGSAAAVAANMCVSALGSDTGGSIRQPASFCGVVGLKPTYSMVSRSGLIAMASSLDQIGPLTKTVEDAKIVFDVIKGQDLLDSTTIELNPKSQIINLKQIQNSKFSAEGGSLPASRHGASGGKIQNLKIGLPKEYFGQGLDSEVEKVVQGAVKKLQDAGHEIKEISLPMSEYALAAYYIIMPAEVSANLARFDGIRYGLSIADSRGHQKTRTDADTLYDVYAKTRAEGFGAEVKRRIMLGTYTLSAGYYDAYYLKAQKVRRLIKEDFEKAFKEVDLIVGPTSPTPAFKFGERTADPLKMYLADIYTVAVNLAGLPGLSMNAGWVYPEHGRGAEKDGKKLPVGIQFIAPWFEEERIFAAANQLEKALV